MKVRVQYFSIPPDERKNPRLHPVLDAFVVRVLRRQVALCHDAVREANPGQEVDLCAKGHTFAVT